MPRPTTWFRGLGTTTNGHKRVVNVNKEQEEQDCDAVVIKAQPEDRRKDHFLNTNMRMIGSGGRKPRCKENQIGHARTRELSLQFGRETWGFLFGMNLIFWLVLSNALPKRGNWRGNGCAIQFFRIISRWGTDLHGQFTPTPSKEVNFTKDNFYTYRIF